MQYQSDYVLRLIEQMGQLIRKALERMNGGSAEEAYDLAEQAIGQALEMDPMTVAKLAPHSLASLLEMSQPDERVLSQVAEAIDIQAELLEREGEFIAAKLRREQAAAVRALTDPGRAN